MSFHVWKRLSILVAVVALTAPSALAVGPYLVVAGSGDNLVTAIDMGAPGYPIAGSTKMGQQALGVVAVNSRIGVTDFLGGKVIALTAQRVGNYLGVGKLSIPTTPDLVNPEGIVPTGIGGWALVTDGVSVAGGAPVGVTLVDVIAGKRLSSVLLPSAYGVAFSPLAGMAFVLDGVSSQVALVKLTPGGLVDTGTRYQLSGPATQARFIAIDEATNRLFVSFKLTGEVETLDATTGASLGMVGNLGTVIGAIAITPDGQKALVADYAGSTWAVLDISQPGLPVDTGTRIVSPLGVPNTFSGTITFAFWGDLMCFSATNSNVAVALNWKTLAMDDDMAVPVGLTPAGMALSW